MVTSICPNHGPNFYILEVLEIVLGLEISNAKDYAKSKAKAKAKD